MFWPHPDLYKKAVHVSVKKYVVAPIETVPDEIEIEELAETEIIANEINEADEQIGEANGVYTNYLIPNANNY